MKKYPRFIYFYLIILLIENLAPLKLIAQDFRPSMTVAPDTGKPFILAPASLISDQYYSLTHSNSSLNLTVISLSSGTANITLSTSIAPWISRNSEGIFFAEYWIEKIDPQSGVISIASYSGVIPINVNSGTNGSLPWNWSTQLTDVNYGTSFRVFGYCYMYNQGGGQQGELALYSTLGLKIVPFPTDTPIPTSLSSSLVLGEAFNPTINSTETMNSFIYEVLGQTNLQSIQTAWYPKIAGTYLFTVGELSGPLSLGNTNDLVWGNCEINPTPYTLTVSQRPIIPTTSFNTTINVGSPWCPSYLNTNPEAGPNVFCIAGETNFGNSGVATQSWTPYKSGNYLFYVGQQITNHDYTYNVTDPSLGPLELNTTAYSLTVLPNPQIVTSKNASVTLGQAFTPTYINSVGSGSNNFQFCIFNFTNYDGGLTQNLGTCDPSLNNNWVQSWTAPMKGVYHFSVAEDANSQFSACNLGEEYTLTVTEPPLSPIIQIPTNPVLLVVTPTTILQDPPNTFTQLAPINNTLVPVTQIPITTVPIPVAPITSAASSSVTPLVISLPQIVTHGIYRIRFNALGHDAFITTFIHPIHLCFIWTDPILLKTNHWPNFLNPSLINLIAAKTPLSAPQLAFISNH